MLGTKHRSCSTSTNTAIPNSNKAFPLGNKQNQNPFLYITINVERRDANKQTSIYCTSSFSNNYSAAPLSTDNSIRGFSSPWPNQPTRMSSRSTTMDVEQQQQRGAQSADHVKDGDEPEYPQGLRMAAIVASLFASIFIVAVSQTVLAAAIPVRNSQLPSFSSYKVPTIIFADTRHLHYTDHHEQLQKQRRRRMVQHRRASLRGGVTPPFRPNVRALEQQMGIRFFCGGLPRRQRDLRGCSYLDRVHHRADDTGRWAGWCLWGHIHTDRADHAAEDTESLRWLVRCRLRYCGCRWASHR